MEESWLRQVGNVATDTVLVTSLGVKSVKPWAKRDTNLPRTKFELEWRQKECAWTTLESVKQRWVTWDNILQIKTTTESISWSRMCTMAYQVWQTFLCGKNEAPSFALCSGRGSIKHILRICRKAPAEGRYRWRHDQVPESSCSDSSLSHHGQQTPPPKEDHQLCPGPERHKLRPKSLTGLLASAGHWQLKANLVRQAKVSRTHHCNNTQSRPDCPL